MVIDLANPYTYWAIVAAILVVVAIVVVWTAWPRR